MVVLCAAARGYVIYRKDEVRKVFGHGFVNPPSIHRPIVFKDIDTAMQVKTALDVAIITTGVWEDAVEVRDGDLTIAENIRLSVEVSYIDIEYCDIREARDDEV
ncbi:hypothetical protein ATCVCanal1_016R [Acanthocystis turfacea Chlorella virus Canal-1]|nr:hypothetical protein ATCVCanal1_016R [Acanthocystis turfacea Chlorella virus Canal-1]